MDNKLLLPVGVSVGLACTELVCRHLIMFRRTITSRLRATWVPRGVSPFALFLKNQKGLFRGLAVKERANLLGKKWRAMSAAEKAALVAAAKAHKGFPKVVKVKKPRKAGPFARFVKANYSKVANQPFKTRLKTLSKMWSNRK